MDRNAGDRCVLVSPETVESDIKPLMNKGYVLAAKLRSNDQEQVLLRRPEEINPSTQAELLLRPSITAG